MVAKLLILADDHRIQARPVEKFHNQKLLVFRRDAVRKGFDHPRVLNRYSNLTLGRFFKTFEAGLESQGFLPIEYLETDDLIRFSVTRLVELGHGAGYGFAQEFVSREDVDLATSEQRFENPAKVAHDFYRATA